MSELQRGTGRDGRTGCTSFPKMRLRGGENGVGGSSDSGGRRSGGWTEGGEVRGREGGGETDLVSLVDL